jgi:hypothetical protein
MTRWIAVSFRPGAGKNPLLKNRPDRASALSRLHEQHYIGWNVGALPRPNLKAGVSLHALVFVPDSQQMEWPSYPCPRRCSEFLCYPSIALYARRIRR